MSLTNTSKNEKILIVIIIIVSIAIIVALFSMMQLFSKQQTIDKPQTPVDSAVEESAVVDTSNEVPVLAPEEPPVPSEAQDRSIGLEEEIFSVEEREEFLEKLNEPELGTPPPTEGEFAEESFTAEERAAFLKKLNN